MDYRAVAELIWLSLLGVSVVLGVLMVGARFILRPLIQEYLRTRRAQDDAREEARLTRIERRLLEMESELQRVRVAQGFDRRLGSGSPDSPTG